MAMDHEMDHEIDHEMDHAMDHEMKISPQVLCSLLILYQGTATGFQIRKEIFM